MADVADDTSRPITEDRGEMALLLDGQALGLRPSFEAIQAIETEVGRGLVELARDAIGGRLSLAVTAQVATQCIRAWGRDAGNKGAAGANADRIACLILDSDGGLLEAQKVVAQMLSMAVTGGFNSAGEAKPSTTKTKTTEAPHVDG